MINQSPSMSSDCCLKRCSRPRRVSVEECRDILVIGRYSSPLRVRSAGGVHPRFASLTAGCALFLSSKQVIDKRSRHDLVSVVNDSNEFSHIEGWEGSADVDDWEPLRLLGRSMLDFTLRYFKEVHTRPVRPPVRPGYLKARGNENGMGCWSVVNWLLL